MNAATKRLLKVWKGYRLGRCMVYPVEWQGDLIGCLEKWPDTRNARHPYKAFLYRHHNAPADSAPLYVGAFYEADGGRRAALDHLLVARDAEIEAGRLKESW